MRTSVMSLYALNMKAIGKMMVALCIVLMLNACQDQATVDLNKTLSPTDVDMNTIAGTFARALESADFRLLLKNEATMKFDNDYDVLVQMIANKEVQPGTTVTRFLGQYSNGADIGGLLRKYPLLSVYVPKLEGFNADTWNVGNDRVPQVAVTYSTNDQNQVKLVDSSDQETWISRTEAPTVPVIVLKENERVGLRTGEPNNGRTTAIFSNADFTYYLLDENGGENGNARSGFSNSFDSKVIAAFGETCSDCYHRDYIYYGISPSEGINQGPFDTRYAEAVTALEFENLAALQSVSSDWTEGDLEFHIIALFIGGASTLTQLEKVYHVSPNAFYDGVQLKQNWISSPLVIVPWEMNVYGDKWKFNVIEFDPGTTTAVTTSHSTTNSSNFSFSTELNALIKIGSGYGGSTTTVDSKSTTITTTTSSNQLGEAIHNWFDPVIVSWKPSGITISYTTKTISTGSIKLSVEPIRVNP